MKTKAQGIAEHIEETGGYDMDYMDACAKSEGYPYATWAYMVDFIKHHENVRKDTAARVLKLLNIF
jgi:hypothetical protein